MTSHVTRVRVHSPSYLSACSASFALYTFSSLSDIVKVVESLFLLLLLVRRRANGKGLSSDSTRVDTHRIRIRVEIRQRPTRERSLAGRRRRRRTTIKRVQCHSAAAFEHDERTNNITQYTSQTKYYACEILNNKMY